jgi:hypothetical protein
MASFNKFQQFVEDLGDGVHQLKAAGHMLKVYASNATPDAAADAVKADLAEITAENGYPSGGRPAVAASDRSATFRSTTTRRRRPPIRSSAGGTTVQASPSTTGRRSRPTSARASSRSRKAL